MSDYIKRIELERDEKWEEWNRKIPELSFHEGWKIKPLAPFCGALVRFLVKLDGASVSVYLDVNDSLGCVGQPYWEIYPFKEDVARFYINEVDELISAIDASLAEQLIKE